MENNKIQEVDEHFMRILAKNINGKRAVLQRKGKEILWGLKKRTCKNGDIVEEGQLEEAIKNGGLSEEESALLLR